MNYEEWIDEFECELAADEHAIHELEEEDVTGDIDLSALAELFTANPESGD